MNKGLFSLTLSLFLIALCFTLSAKGSEEVDPTRGDAIDVKPESTIGSMTDTTAPEALQGEKFQFQAEVNRLMDIIIHSLYSNRDIFLRELISNASDAIDKIRFLALTDPSLINDSEELAIYISIDKENKAVIIQDKGVGMSKNDLIDHLGTIAKSGTASFLEKATNNPNADNKNLIGQFGVGFYSSYLVADRVRVVTKQVGDKQWIWESMAAQTFTISEDEKGEHDLGAHGTKIMLFLKDDASSYLDFNLIQKLIKKYSQFIHFPIYLETVTEEEIEVPVEEGEEPIDEEDVKLDDDDDDDDSEDEESKAPKTKKEKREKREFVVQNSDKPIWLRESSEISDDEYDKFFTAISKDKLENPIARTHFKAEGEIDFRSILYIPPFLKPGILQGEADSESLRLYVRRVLVTDVFEGTLLPKYLSFITGIVDSDDLPINVSREMLQKSKILDVIKRKLIRKVLEMIKNLIDDEEKTNKEESKDKETTEVEKEATETTEVEKEATETTEVEKEATETTEVEKEVTEVEKKPSQYIKFWKSFGKAIKLGLIEDDANRQRLAKLCRFKSSATDLKNEDDWTSLDAYVDRMKDDQEHIYYLSGESLDQIEHSPFLEKILEKGYEVIFLYEPLDEHAVLHLPDYEGNKFMSINKDSFKFGDADQEKEKENAAKARKFYKPLIKFLKDALGERVSKVKISTRLTNSPCVLASDQYGYTPQMEIIMRAQAFSDPTALNHQLMKQKVMEINPNHPIIKGLMVLIENEDMKEKAETIINVLYDSALISSGYYLHHQKEYSKRMGDFISESIQQKLGEDAGVMTLDFEEFVKRNEEIEAEKTAKNEEEEKFEIPESEATEKEEL